MTTSLSTREDRGTLSQRRRSIPASPPTITAMAAIAALAACSGTEPGVYQGYVEGEFVHVGSGVAGRLERLNVARGQAVEAKAALFELESSQEAAAVRQAEEAVNAAGAQLADLGTGKRGAERGVVGAQLEQARAAEEQSASQLAYDTARLEAGGISRMQLDASRAKHDADRARVRELEGQLRVADLAARPEQIRAQSAQVAAARAAADATRWRLDQTRVVAAQAGLVVDTLYREGEWVPAGAPVVRLLPPSGLKVRFFVPEAALPLVPVGREVKVRCDGCPTEVAATVSFVATEPEFTPPVIYSNENRAKMVFLIEARPAAGGGAVLRPGQPVEVVAP